MDPEEEEKKTHTRKPVDNMLHDAPPPPPPPRPTPTTTTTQNRYVTGFDEIADQLLKWLAEFTRVVPYRYIFLENTNLNTNFPEMVDRCCTTFWFRPALEEVELALCASAKPHVSITDTDTMMDNSNTDSSSSTSSSSSNINNSSSSSNNKDGHDDAVNPKHSNNDSSGTSSDGGSGGGVDDGGDVEVKHNLRGGRRRPPRVNRRLIDGGDDNAGARRVLMVDFDVSSPGGGFDGGSLDAAGSSSSARGLFFSGKCAPFYEILSRLGLVKSSRRSDWDAVTKVAARATAWRAEWKRGVVAWWHLVEKLADRQSFCAPGRDELEAYKAAGRALVVISPPGAGKTTFLENYVQRWAEERFKSHNVIMVDCSSDVLVTRSLSDFLATALPVVGGRYVGSGWWSS